MASVPTAAKTKAKAKTKSATFPELAAFVERIDAILANHTTANTDRPERFGRHSANRTAIERNISPLAEMNLKLAIEEMTEEHPDQADELHGISHRIGKFIARLRRFENRPEWSANHPDAAEVVRYEVASRQLRELRGDWGELKANDLATLATIAGGEESVVTDRPEGYLRCRRTQHADTLEIDGQSVGELTVADALFIEAATAYNAENGQYGTLKSEVINRMAARKPKGLAPFQYADPDKAFTTQRARTQGKLDKHSLFLDLSNHILTLVDLRKKN